MKRLIPVFWVVLSTILLCPLLYVGALLLSEPLARSMTPPTYPNSQLVDMYTATGSWGYTEFHHYSTSDSVATVDNWYSNYASNFNRTLMETGGISFDDSVSDSLLAHIVGYVNGADWGSGPGGGLTIYPDPKNPGLTQITVTIAWPSP